MPSRAAVVAKNKKHGALFEGLFVARAGVDGMQALKNELSFKWLPGGRVQPLRSDLDFRVLGPGGQVAFVDCKVVGSPYFTVARIDKTQAMRALNYNQRQVRAGFVVLFTDFDAVYFYDGRTLAQSGAKVRFSPDNGLHLGHYLHFSLRPIFAQEA